MIKTWSRVLVALGLMVAAAGCGGGTSGGSPPALVTYAISGTVTTGGSPAPGVTLGLSGTATASATTDASGNYSFGGLANGSYSVTPSETGYTFTPASASVTVNGANVTAQNFSSTGAYSISGVVSGAVASGVSVALSGAVTAATTTDGSGNYSFAGLPNGSYTVTPSLAGGYGFTPASRSVTVNGASLSAQNFSDTGAYSISGVVSGAVASGVSVALSGAVTAATTTDGSGNYSFAGLPNGSYTVTPSLAGGYGFTPASRSVTVNGASLSAQNFSDTGAYSISGVVSGAVASGVSVALSGAVTAATTTDGSGNYSFAGLPNGSYTVTPSLAGGYGFTPASRSVTVNGASLSAQNFSDTGAYSISGVVSGAVASGVSVALSGAVTAATTTDGSGNYSFAGLPNGSYTVTPSLAGGYGFTPASRSVTVNGASLSAQNFTATLVCIWQEVGSFDLTTKPAGSTTNNGAIGGQGGQAVYGRTAWYQSSDWNTLYVPMGLAGTDDVFATQADFYAPAGTGFELNAGLGAFETDLGGGNYSHGVSIAPVRLTDGTYRLDWRVRSGQTESVVQSTSLANFTAQWHTLRLEGIRSTCTFRALIDGTQVDSWTGTCDLAGTTTDLRSWKTNFGTAVDVAWSNLTVLKGSVPACLQLNGLSGTISGAVQAGVSVILSGASTATTVTDASGNYSFGGLANGNYTVTPLLAGYTFAPASRSVTVNGASLGAQNFTATCSWQQVYSYDLTSLPPGATATNGAMGGQGAQTAYGRTAWYVWSDWNLLTVPVTLAPTDSYFAAQVDFYLPAGSSTQEQRAGMFLFNDPNPGISFGSHGLLATVQNSGVGSSALRWWVYPQTTDTFNATSTVSFTPTAWHTLRVEGDRQTCSFRAFIDGLEIDYWNGTCDTSGAKLSLYSRDNAVQPTGVAWSNLKIFKVSAAACVE